MGEKLLNYGILFAIPLSVGNFPPTFVRKYTQDYMDIVCKLTTSHTYATQTTLYE